MTQEHKPKADNHEIIPPHGGYRNLKSFQIAQLVYDLTVRFCDAYVDKWSRTHDQMVQAARSGVQNIAEGSMASATSRKIELKLTNIAKASLEELRLDYEDFLRHRKLPLWDKRDPRREDLFQQRCASADEVAHWAKKLHDRGLGGQSGQGGQDTAKESDKPATYPEIAANAVLLLIAVASSLLDRQVASQADTFKKEGGFTERLYRVRKQQRGNPES